MIQSTRAIFMTVHLPASLTLDEINEDLAYCEKNVGPIVLMNIDNDVSLLRFAATAARPTKFAKIAPQKDGKPDVPEGEELVTTGRIFIAGEQVLCAATRTKEES